MQGRSEITLEEAEKLHSKIDQPNKAGQLTPFCFMLKRLLVVFIAAKKKGGKKN